MITITVVVFVLLIVKSSQMKKVRDDIHEMSEVCQRNTPFVIITGGKMSIVPRTVGRRSLIINRSNLLWETVR